MTKKCVRKCDDLDVFFKIMTDFWQPLASQACAKPLNDGSVCCLFSLLSLLLLNKIGFIDTILGCDHDFVFFGNYWLTLIVR